MDYKIILIIIAVIASIIGKTIYDIIVDKKKTINNLLMEWGQFPQIEYGAGKIESIKKYYVSMIQKYDIDDITWNDLALDELFEMINHTESAVGEEVLYSLLRRPLLDSKQISYRHKLISFFQKNQDDRVNLQYNLRRIGRNSRLSFYEYFSRIDDIKKESNLIHIIINLIYIVSIVGMFFNSVAFLTLLIIDIVFAIASYYKRKSEIEAYYSVFSYILKLLYCSNKIVELDIKSIENELNEISVLIKEFSGFKRNSGIVLNPNGGSLADIIFDYIRMLTHIDLIKFNSMLKVVLKRKNSILNIHDKVGFLDSMIALASFRDTLKDTGWCVPEILENNIEIKIDKLYHPFLEEPVFNDFSTSGSILVTGSNASGKSTFLKSVAINAIMAQSFATVMADSYKACCFRVMTSMALNDNIFNNKSYFIVEIMSLKRIIDSTGDVPILCCIDEVLRGTNTIERIAASSQILKNLGNLRVVCLAATHDVELAHILNGYYDNYHFQEKIEDDNIIFDYKLYNGCSQTRNAIKLLQLLGYKKDIVENAANEADLFQSTGSWRTL